MRDLIQLADDMVTLTKELSSAVKPKTDDALEIIDDVLKRVKTGKYDKLVKDQATKTRARIKDELNEKKYNPAALRSQMRTQNVEWKTLRDMLASKERLANASIDKIQETVSKVPKSIPKGQSFIKFRHNVIFTTRVRIPKEKLNRLPPSYEPGEVGSGLLWRNQLIVAFPDPGTVSKGNKMALDIIEVINSDSRNQYVPSFSETQREVFFRVPGSKLLYVWLIFDKAAKLVSMEVRSVTLPDSDIDTEIEDVKRNVDPGIKLDRLKKLREEFEKIVKNDSQLIDLRAQLKRQEILSRPTNAITGKIKDRTAELRADFMKQNK